MPIERRPVVVGFGPGDICRTGVGNGRFAAARLGAGRDIDSRISWQVKRFWQDGALNPESNVQLLAKAEPVLLLMGSLPASMIHGSAGYCSSCIRPELTRVSDRCTSSYRYRYAAASSQKSPVPGSLSWWRIALSTSHRLAMGTRPFDRSYLLADQQVIPARSWILAIGHSARDTFEMCAAKRGCPWLPRPFHGSEDRASAG